MAIQGKVLKIGELEEVLAGALNRNQIKYLITKLFEDNVIATEGAGRGTRYKITAPLEVLRGDPLINEVLASLRAWHAE